MLIFMSRDSLVRDAQRASRPGGTQLGPTCDAPVGFFRGNRASAANPGGSANEARHFRMSNGQIGRQVLVEIAVDSAADAQLAVDLGPDRPALGSHLDRHGLTPDPGLVREVTRRTRVPVMAMLRPRSGPFVLAPAELERLCDQAAALLAAGASGLVFGALREDGTIDVRACERILELAGGSSVTFHRALDLTPDPRAAGEEL